MKARDVMTTRVITVGPGASVQEVAQLLLQYRISAVPVVGEGGRLIGIVSEGDLVRRAEVDTERRRPWWLRMLTGSEVLAAEYVKSHASKVADLMTKRVITATPDASLRDIATLLEKHSIKRVPIVENDRLAGIVTRANLVQALATIYGRPHPEVHANDAAIRDSILSHLDREPWARLGLLNVTVKDGVVDLWGMVNSESERSAIRVAAESTPAVRAVNDHLVQQPAMTGGY